MQNLANGQNLNTTLGGGQGRDTFYVKSLMTPQSAPLSNSSIAAFFNYLGNQGASSDTAWFVQIETYGGSNSKINTVASTATAFVHRDSLFTIQFYASSSNYGLPYPSDGVSFVSGMVSAITDNEPSGWASGGYPNYVDTQLTPEEGHEFYYGSNYARLSQLKSQYDPNDVFSFPTAIQGFVLPESGWYGAYVYAVTAATPAMAPRLTHRAPVLSAAQRIPPTLAMRPSKGSFYLDLGGMALMCMQ
jgi:hypothetical protein